jgi:hypothetical protein
VKEPNPLLCGEFSASTGCGIALTLRLLSAQQQHIGAGDTVTAVKNLVFSCALFALALPGAAVAQTRTPNEGTLLIKDGVGKITITAKGGVIGRFGEGVLTVRDPKPDDDINEVVTGAERRDDITEQVTKYWGKDIRFRYIGGKFTVTIVGSNIDLSAIGKGTVFLSGKGTADDGTFSLNGTMPQPFPGPFFPLTLQLSPGNP